MNANDIERAGANMNETVRRLQHTIEDLTNGVVLWNQQDRMRLQREIDELKNDVAVKCMEKVNLRNEAKQLQHRLAQAEQDTKHLVGLIRAFFEVEHMRGTSAYANASQALLDAAPAMKETKP